MGLKRTEKMGWNEGRLSYQSSQFLQTGTIELLALSMCSLSREENSDPEGDSDHQDDHPHHGPREQGRVRPGSEGGASCWLPPAVQGVAIQCPRHKAFQCSLGGWASLYVVSEAGLPRKATKVMLSPHWAERAEHWAQQDRSSLKMNGIFPAGFSTGLAIHLSFWFLTFVMGHLSHACPTIIFWKQQLVWFHSWRGVLPHDESHLKSHFLDLNEFLDLESGMS